MSKRTAAFWKNTATETPVQRRVLWQFPDGQGELSVAVYPNQPVPDLAWMTEPQVEAVTVDGTSLVRGQAVAPRMLFASVETGSHAEVPVVTGPNHREITLVESPAPAEAAGDGSMQDKLQQAGAAILPAQVAAGDHVLGFLVRMDVLYFYPLAAVNIPEEVEAFKEGTGSTNDLIQELPFQS